LLNRRVEGIEIGMQDRRRRDWRKFHTHKLIEHMFAFQGSTVGPSATCPVPCARFIAGPMQ
jgi:hypothetical protein